MASPAHWRLGHSRLSSRARQATGKRGNHSGSEVRFQHVERADSGRIIEIMNHGQFIGNCNNALQVRECSSQTFLIRRPDSRLSLAARSAGCSLTSVITRCYNCALLFAFPLARERDLSPIVWATHEQSDKPSGNCLRRQSISQTLGGNIDVSTLKYAVTSRPLSLMSLRM